MRAHIPIEKKKKKCMHILFLLCYLFWLVLRSGFSFHVLVLTFSLIGFNFQVVQHYLKSGLCSSCFEASPLSFCRVVSSIMAGDFLMSTNGNGNGLSDPRRTYQVVVAATRAMGIGKDGKLPWNLPSDLKFFKEITMKTSDPVKKNAVLMGRKTWESIPVENRPLPGRLNVVLTRSGSFDIATAENVVICGSMASALELLAASPYCLSIEKVFVIGGGEILRCAFVVHSCTEELLWLSFSISIDNLYIQGNSQCAWMWCHPYFRNWDKLWVWHILACDWSLCISAMVLILSCGGK